MVASRFLKKWFRFLPVLLLMGSTAGQLLAQKEIGDLTLHYDMVEANNRHLDSSIIKQASKILYIRGGMSLSTIQFNQFTQSIIYNQNGDKAYVFYHFNNQDYLSILNKAQWEDQYHRYKGMKLTILDGEHKTILGYHCQKAVARLKDGTEMNLFFTPELKTTVGDNPYEYKLVPGLILEYEARFMKKYTITFTATKIDFNPVPASRFIIPKEGYRLLDPAKLKKTQ